MNRCDKSYGDRRCRLLMGHSSLHRTFGVVGERIGWRTPEEVDELRAAASEASHSYFEPGGRNGAR